MRPDRRLLRLVGTNAGEFASGQGESEGDTVQDYQDEMMESFLDVSSRNVRDLVVDKFRRAEVPLSETEVSSLLSDIRQGRLDEWLKGTSSPDASTSVMFTEADIEEVKKEIARAREEVFGDDALARMRDAAVDEFFARWASVSIGRNEDSLRFLDEIDSLWHEAFERLEMMRYVLVAFGEQGICYMERKINEGQAKRTDMLELTILLLSRACQLLGEIIVLVRHGFAEGALARWRSLHEIDVTLSFIDKHGGDIAERFLAHDVAETRKALNQYDQTFGRRTDEPVPEAERRSIEADCQSACSLYGEEFKNDYGWAADALGNKKPTFNLIEKDVGLEFFRGDYSLASHGIHAKTKSISYRPSQPPYTADAIAGGSVYGLSDPIVNCAATTYHFYTTAARQWPDVNSLVATDILKRLFEEISAIANGVEERLNEAALPDAPDSNSVTANQAVS